MNRLIAAGINEIIYHGFPYVYMDRPEPGWFPFAPPVSFSDHFNPHNTKIWSAVPRLNAYITRLQYIAQNARPIAKYAVYRLELDYPNRTDLPQPLSRDYDLLSRDGLNRCHIRNGKLVAPSGAEYDALVIPSPDADLQRKYKNVKVIVGAIPADDTPTRWKAGGGEFQFYFNDSEAAKDIALRPGEYEDWDAYTGRVLAFPQNHLSLAEGQARLLFRIQPRR